MYVKLIVISVWCIERVKLESFQVLITGDYDTGDKFTTGFNNNGYKFTAGVRNTGHKFITVSFPRGKNVCDSSPVSTTPGDKVMIRDTDTGGKIITDTNTSDKFMTSVADTGQNL